MEKKKFAILGGDNRNIELAYSLIEDGHEVDIYGFNKLDLFINERERLHEAIIDSDVVVGPLPFSEDEKTFNAPHFTGEIQIQEVLNLLKKKQIFTAGKVSSEVQDKFKQNGLIIVDYFAREEMQALNAIPTAEGAIQLAMEELKITLHGSNTLVLGYGRIGKALSKMLYGIGANVYVEARNFGDLAWIKNNGYNPIHLSQLQYYIGKMDVIFNTVPQIILGEALQSKIKSDCIIFEMASKPGGIDIEAAKTKDFKLVSAQGLPGKVAPISAARVIKDTIYNIIDEVEE